MEQKNISTISLEEKLTISVEEAAKMLGIGRNLMLDLVKNDNFPAMKFDRKIIINKKQFIQWFNDLTAGKINI